MKRVIEPFDYANEIMRAVETGVLLTTKAGDKVNAMTISWGTLGIEWGKPLFTVFVRESRFTKSLLDQVPAFTINVPRGAFDRRILEVCGTQSGRAFDKIAALGLTLEPPEVVPVPGIRELALTLECKVIYSQKQDAQAISEENLRRYYPQSVEGAFHGSNRAFHTAYYGEIVRAYIIE